MSAPASPEIRPLTLADVPRLVALEKLLFGPSAWTEVMLREELEGSGRWYVGVDGPDLVRGEGTLEPPSSCVAYAGLFYDGDVAQVMTLGVAPTAQGRGLGTALLHALVQHARDLGASAVLLEVRVDNQAAISLYVRAGFVVLSRRRRYYQPEGVDAWTMRLLL